MRKNLPAIGQSYAHEDVPLSAQVTRNWYPEINQETNVVVSLQPFPGATVFSEGTGTDRGVTFWNGAIYKVTSTTLYRIGASGSQVAVGTISGAGRCTFPASLEWLVIVTSGNVYTYDGTTLTLVTDVDLEAPNYGTYLNNTWIYQGAGGRWCTSDPGVPASINGLNYATAESDGDALLRPYVYNQTLYLFGTDSVESWYNSGVGNPPFDRIEGGIVQVGLAAADTLSSNDNFMYFLADDMRVHQMSGAQTRPISTIPLSQKFQTYESVSDAVGFCFQYNGQEFYQLTIPGENTWVFNESAGGWFELTLGYEETPHTATAHISAFNKRFFADGGNLMEIGGSTYGDQPIVRERITGLVSGEVYGEDMIGRPLFMSRAEIVIKGVPPLGDAPQIMLSWSDDAGYTWSNERVIDCGVLANYQFKAVAHQLGRFYDRVFKIRISDDNSYSLHRMSGDIDGGN